MPLKLIEPTYFYLGVHFFKISKSVKKNENQQFRSLESPNSRLIPYENLEFNYTPYYSLVQYPWFSSRNYFDIICLHNKKPYNDKLQFFDKREYLFSSIITFFLYFMENTII